MSVALTGALFTECQEQIRSVDAPGQTVAVEAAQPDQWHAVRHNQVRCVQNFPKGRIMLRFDDAVHARCGDGATRATIVNPLLHASYYVGDLHRVYTYTQHSKVRRIF